MNVSLQAVWANLGLMLSLLAVKLVTKAIGVYPPAKRYLPEGATYTTLLMSTGLTFGTISSLYGLNAGLLTKDQFSVLVTVVVLSAVVPTWIAQRFFQPSVEPTHGPEVAAVVPRTETARRIGVAAEEE
jgi:Kef-type K+ transport system membrane component KefB